MPKLKIKYYLSEQGRKKSLLCGGDGKREQCIYTDITKEYLEYASVNNNGDAIIDCISNKEFIINTKFGGKPYITCSHNGILEFNSIQTPESILKFLKEQENIKPSDELNKLLEERYKEYEEVKKIKEERENAELIERQKRAALELEKHNREKEIIRKEKEDKEMWINEHGSQYLKDAFNLGYDCQRRYVDERIKLELPEFIVDFDNKITIKDRTTPSEKALYESIDLINKGYEAKVSWTDTYIDDWFCNGVEIISIDNFLSKYFLYKVIG